MPYDPSKAERDIPMLRSFVNRLLQLANKIFQSKISYQESDHLAFMSRCFVSAQIEHLNTIKILVEGGQDRDAELIARCMIEGMGLLIWAAREPSSRPLLWREYIWVQDFRLMEEKKQAGKSVDVDKESIIRGQFNICGSKFLTKRGKKAKNKGESLQLKHCHKSWSGRNAKDILYDVGGEFLYEKIYRETSQLIHWTPRGLGSTICREGEKVSFVWQSPSAAATALTSGFQALLQSLQVLNSHLKLDFDAALYKVYTEYVNTFSSDK